MVDDAENIGTELISMFPLEFYLTAVPLSLQASSTSKERWKITVADAARQRAEETAEFIWLDSDPVAVTIFYFPTAPMAGDVDNIVKPILDALKRVSRSIAARLRSTLPQERDQACGEIAALLVAEIDGPSICVVRADVPDGAYSPGRFGIDEPWPGTIDDPATKRGKPEKQN